MVKHRGTKSDWALERHEEEELRHHAIHGALQRREEEEEFTGHLSATRKNSDITQSTGHLNVERIHRKNNSDTTQTAGHLNGKRIHMAIDTKIWITLSAPGWALSHTAVYSDQSGGRAK